MISDQINRIVPSSELQKVCEEFFFFFEKSQTETHFPLISKLLVHVVTIYHQKDFSIAKTAAKTVKTTDQVSCLVKSL